MPIRSAPLIARHRELRARWLALCDSLGIPRRYSQPEGRRLLGRWDQVPRHYHDTRHLLACLRALDDVLATVPDQVGDASACALALWFHDAIYAPRRHDNEVLSAAWAQRFLAAAGVPQERVDAVVHLVLQTQHVTPPAPKSLSAALQADTAWVLDIDLGILGQSPAVCARFEADVRREYRFVPDAEWRKRRAAVLSSFLHRNSIYRTAYFRDRLEATARTNLGKTVQQLTMPN
ncbi:MAG: hypothetical protein RJA10_2326 [Pseudomonadota bacterium]|jgi:predicted metal-dependent HD superfamily phosphohydrolase